MEFRVLGPIEAERDGCGLRLGGPKQRALLAMLLLRANEVVSRDRLIDGLWGESPPPSAGHTLDDYISRLRKTLGSEPIITRAPGYILHVDPGELDLSRFERLVEQGAQFLSRGRPGEAADALRAALELWRGAALADVLYAPFAAVEAERLEEARLGALEQRFEADLAVGRSAELVGELEALVRAHPLREHLLYQLMLALYRSGRQSTALEMFRDARRHFVEDLGLEPGQELRTLQRRILEQDPSLDRPEVETAGPPRSATDDDNMRSQSWPRPAWSRAWRSASC